MTTFDRYLLKRFLHSFLILFVSTYGLFVVIDGFTNVDGFQEGREGTREVLETMGWYYAVQAAPFFNLVGPLLTVVSVMIVFVTLQKNSEFHPVLAAGVPTVRLLLPILCGHLLISGALAVNQEVVIPRLAHELIQPRSRKDSETDKVEPVYDRRTRIHIGGDALALTERKLKGAEFLLPIPHIVGEMTKVKAAEAEYLPETPNHKAGWLLRGVERPYEEIRLTPEGRKIVLRLENPRDLFIVSRVGFDQLYNRTQNYKYVSIPALIRRIRNPTVGNASLRGQILHLHSRLTRPLLTFGVLVVAVCLIVRRESRSLVTNVAFCTAVLGGLAGIAQIIAYLGQVNLIAPDLAAWIPVILSGTSGVWCLGIVQT